MNQMLERKIIPDLVSIGPALVDISIDIPELKDYLRIIEFLQTKPGGWVYIHETRQLEEVLAIALNTTVLNLFRDFDQLLKKPSVDVIAGSTGLGFLSAFPKLQRRRSAIVSTVGSPDGKNPDPISQIFTRDLHSLNIRHYSYPVRGNSAVGLVLSTKTIPEKVLAMMPGVAYELVNFPSEIPKGTVIHLDAYELRKGKISETLDQLITSRRYKIALGLGNSSILEGDLKRMIIDYVFKGKIEYLMGNSSEFSKLFSEKESELFPNEQALSALGVQNVVPHVLITFGENGMCSWVNNRFYYNEACPTSKIVNTSGAGDTAAGVFISGLLVKEAPQQILRTAALFSAEVLQLKGSKLVDGRN